MQSWDLVVIGGGVNGVAIACDAAGRGLSVRLCEQGDLASGTSNWSTKLIHGGLRYLENREFRMVKEALHERTVLMQKAPFLIHPLEFVLPHDKQGRPAWMLRCGLWLYDWLDRRGPLPKSKRVNLLDYGSALSEAYDKGFSYYDCQTDDARLVVLTARLAQQHGADIQTHVFCQKATRVGDHWQLDIHNLLDATNETIQAKAIINASGPYVSSVSTDVLDDQQPLTASLIKGSHMVVPRCYDGDHAYLLQATDGRIVFLIPYQQHYTLVGTTDVPYDGDLASPMISDHEVDYLCSEVNHYLQTAITPEDIVWTYSGVRTLASVNQSASKLSRDYHLETRDQGGRLPVIHVVGGKLTTHRVLAEDVMQLLTPYFPHIGKPWTSSASLPGGDMQGLSADEQRMACHQRYPWMSDAVLQRYWGSYGMETHALLSGCANEADLGEHFGAGLFAIEVDYLIANEWALTVDDILWRRSKLGLKVAEIDQPALSAYVLSRVAH